LTDFENSFTVGNSNKLSIKYVQHFEPFLKTSCNYGVKHNNFKMLQLLYHSFLTKLSTPPIFFTKFFNNLKKHITLLTYLLHCPAARVSGTSSQR